MRLGTHLCARIQSCASTESLELVLIEWREASSELALQRIAVRSRHMRAHIRIRLRALQLLGIRGCMLPLSYRWVHACVHKFCTHPKCTTPNIYTPRPHPEINASTREGSELHSGMYSVAMTMTCRPRAPHPREPRPRALQALARGSRRLKVERARPKLRACAYSDPPSFATCSYHTDVCLSSTP